MIYDDLYKEKQNDDPKATSSESNPPKPAPPAESPKDLLVKIVSVHFPEERRALLESGISFWPEASELKLLKEFFDIRYRKEKSRNFTADRFLGILIELLAYASMGSGTRNLKSLTKKLKNSEFLKWSRKERAESELARELFFGECMQMIGFFFYSCKNDKRYASSLLGLIKASPEKVRNKIYNDLSSCLRVMKDAEKSEKTEEWTTDMKILIRAFELFLNRFDSYDS